LYKLPFFPQYLSVPVTFINAPSQWQCSTGLFQATGSSTVMQLTAVAL
jgi:hypothetical protein